MGQKSTLPVQFRISSDSPEGHHGNIRYNPKVRLSCDREDHKANGFFASADRLSPHFSHHRQKLTKFLFIDCPEWCKKDSADPAVGTASVFVDGEKVLDYDPHVVGWCHCNAVIVFRGGELKKRHIEVVVNDPTKNFTILGFGIVR